MIQRRRLLACACPLALLMACNANDLPATSAVERIADDYYAFILEHYPESAYFSAIDIDRHDGLHDNRLASMPELQDVEDALLARLEAVPLDELRGTPLWIAAVLMLEQLQANVALRVCRQALWNVSHMDGWHLAYGELASLQPVASADERSEALRRWAKFPAYVDTEIDNLRSGIAAGFSAPRPVVERVIEQLDGLLQLPAEELPFYSPARRSEDGAFDRAFGELVREQIAPAMQRYRDFLANDYLADARESLAVSANPDGAACYAASLRAYTTLGLSGRQIFELGSATVAANRDGVIALGEPIYASSDFGTIIRAARADPEDRFDSADELLGFSRLAVGRAAAAMPDWVGKMPDQAVSVVPFPPHEEGTGRSAHYRPGNTGRAAEYRIPLYNPGERSRGNTEVTAFHETWPGHHLQTATAQAVDGLHPVTRLIWFSGPGEGWARYSEALAEEMGLYETHTGPILRRAWPARGMVVDPGIHLFGWTREQAVAFMLEAGRFPPSQADSMVDRIAILPGQLTSYDAGGLAIARLRERAQGALGEDFDVRVFHDRILENGTIPLQALEQHVEAWICRESGDCRIAE